MNRCKSKISLDRLAEIDIVATLHAHIETGYSLHIKPRPGLCESACRGALKGRSGRQTLCAYLLTITCIPSGTVLVLDKMTEMMRIHLYNISSISNIALISTITTKNNNKGTLTYLAGYIRIFVDEGADISDSL